MKKSTILLVLSLLLIAGNLPRCFATPPYRPGGGSRDIDADYRLKAIGDGRIQLCQIRPEGVIFESQGSGNSEYCAKSKLVFLRVVPLAESENENEEENDQKPERRQIRCSPEEISLPGQPYEYYIFEKDTAHVIGPLTEKEFVSHDLVSGLRIKWKFVERTYKEYSNGMFTLGIYIMLVLFCMYVLPFIVLFFFVIYVVRTICKALRERRQTKESH